MSIEYSTSDLVTAANLLQSLNPSKVGLLLVICDDEVQTQGELSDLIGRNQSTISSYIQSLSSLSPPLVAKGRYYMITGTGGKVISLINDVARRSGVDLRTLDWSSRSSRSTIDDLLTPLHDSQIDRPIFVLEALGNRSGIDGPIGSPEAVRFANIVRDVEQRLDDMGKSVTKEEIRRTVKNRFEAVGVVRLEDDLIHLTDKGHQLAWLLSELVHHIEEENSSENEMEREEVLSTDPPRSNQKDVIKDATAASDHVMPVYAPETGEGPILPLNEKTSINELRTSLDQAAKKYGEDVGLELVWMIQTDSGLYPMSPGHTDSLGHQNR
ncbi:hypothetical protein [Halocatena halophila]|uniref:hypothetical protein n=1 Tax=Halocatena halophila TaxID=2814576 RepID=UPI002ED0B5C5